MCTHRTLAEPTDSCLSLYGSKCVQAFAYRRLWSCRTEHGLEAIIGCSFTLALKQFSATHKIVEDLCRINTQDCMHSCTSHACKLVDML